MKNICLMLCVSCLAAVAVGDETAYEGQPIGSIAVTAPGRSAIVAVAFKELSVSDEQVSAANIVSTVNLQDGDELFIYSNDSYDAWTLQNGAWTKVLKTNSEGTTEGPEAAAVRAKIGSGFWLMRNGENRDYAKPFYIFGAVVELVPTTAAAGAKTLMGNPCLTAKTPTITGMSNGDTIQFATGGGTFNTYTYNATKEQWGHWDENNSPVWGGVPEIPAGVGFWYVSKGGEVTFGWR